MPGEKSISGSCACGNIQWTSTSAPAHLDFCYCLTCQKCAGAPFMAFTGIRRASLEWKFSRSEPFIYRSNYGDTDTSIAERMCCGSCGCNISMQYYLYPEKTHVAASSINKNDFEIPKVGCHIWTKHVPAWYSISDDGVERYHEFDQRFQGKLDEYLKTAKNRSEDLKERGGWWAGLMPGHAPDYTAIKGPDTLTMADLWEDPSKVRPAT